MKTIQFWLWVKMRLKNQKRFSRQKMYFSVRIVVKVSTIRRTRVCCWDEPVCTRCCRQPTREPAWRWTGRRGGLCRFLREYTAPTSGLVFWWSRQGWLCDWSPTKLKDTWQNHCGFTGNYSRVVAETNIASSNKLHLCSNWPYFYFLLITFFSRFFPNNEVINEKKGLTILDRGTVWPGYDADQGTSTGTFVTRLPGAWGISWPRPSPFWWGGSSGPGSGRPSRLGAAPRPMPPPWSRRIHFRWCRSTGNPPCWCRSTAHARVAHKSIRPNTVWFQYVHTYIYRYLLFGHTLRKSLCNTTGNASLVFVPAGNGCCPCLDVEAKSWARSRPCTTKDVTSIDNVISLQRQSRACRTYYKYVFFF